MIAFIAVSALVIVTPGPDTALTIRNTLAGGRRAGIATAFGVSLGQLTWTLAMSLGLGALLFASQTLLEIVRLLGALYLVWLGIQTLRGHAAHEREHRTGAFRQGLLSNLGNPKMLAFFTSLLPQFAHSVPGLIGLGLVFCSMTALWLSAYSCVVHRAQAWLRSRVIDAITGTVLVALGIRLAREAH